MFIARERLAHPTRQDTDASSDERHLFCTHGDEASFSSRRQVRHSFISDPRQRVLLTRTNSAEKHHQHTDVYEHRRPSPRRSSAGSYSPPAFVNRVQDGSSRDVRYASADEGAAKRHTAGSSSGTPNFRASDSFVYEPRQRGLLTRTKSAEEQKHHHQADMHKDQRAAPRRSSAGNHSLPMFIVRERLTHPTRQDTDASSDERHLVTNHGEETSFSSRRQVRHSFVSDPRQRVLLTRTNSAEKQKHHHQLDVHEVRRATPRRSSAGGHSLPMFIVRERQVRPTRQDTDASSDERDPVTGYGEEASFSSRRQARHSCISDPRQRVLLTRTNSAEKQKHHHQPDVYEARRATLRRSSAGNQSLPMFIARERLAHPTRQDTEASSGERHLVTNHGEEASFSSRRQVRRSFVSDPRQRVLLTRSNSAEKHKHHHQPHMHEVRRATPRRSSAGGHSLRMFIARERLAHPTRHGTNASSDEQHRFSNHGEEASFSSRRQVRRSFVSDPRQRVLLTRTNSAEKQKHHHQPDVYEVRRATPRRSSAGNYSLPMFVARERLAHPTRQDTDASSGERHLVTNHGEEASFSSRRQVRQSFMSDPRQRVLLARTNSAEKQKHHHQPDVREVRRATPRRSSEENHSLPMFIVRERLAHPTRQDTDASSDERHRFTKHGDEASFSSRRQVRQSFMSDPRQRVLLTRTNSAEKQKHRHQPDVCEVRRATPRRSSAGNYSLPMFVARERLAHPTRQDTEAPSGERHLVTNHGEEASFSSRRQVRQSFMSDPRQRVLLTRTNSAEKHKHHHQPDVYEVRRATPRRSSAGNYSLPMFIARERLAHPTRQDTDASSDERHLFCNHGDEASFSSRRQVRHSFISDLRQRVLLTRTNSAEKHHQHTDVYEHRRPRPRRSSAGSYSPPAFVNRVQDGSSRHATYASADEGAAKRHTAGSSSGTPNFRARDSFIYDPRQRGLLTRTKSAEEQKHHHQADMHKDQRAAPRRSSAGNHSLPMFIVRERLTHPTRQDTDASSDERHLVTNDGEEASFSSRRQVRQSSISDPRQRVLLTRSNSAEKQKHHHQLDVYEARRATPRRSSAGGHSLRMFIARERLAQRTRQDGAGALPGALADESWSRKKAHALGGVLQPVEQCGRQCEVTNIQSTSAESPKWELPQATVKRQYPYSPTGLYGQTSSPNNGAFCGSDLAYGDTSARLERDFVAHHSSKLPVDMSCFNSALCGVPDYSMGAYSGSKLVAARRACCTNTGELSCAKKDPTDLQSFKTRQCLAGLQTVSSIV
ncbi:hypothetical protein Efla_000993 [Eimeria flavescens]